MQQLLVTEFNTDASNLIPAAQGPTATAWQLSTTGRGLHAAPLACTPRLHRSARSQPSAALQAPTLALLLLEGRAALLCTSVRDLEETQKHGGMLHFCVLLSNG